jgi:ubiquinone/menaquinone biosynthesis C-methylase UbiE
MQTNERANREQAELWNGAAGRGWVQAQESLDRLMAPFENLLLEAVAAKGARRVLDIGCGTGATTLAIARHLGERGNAVGLDISEPMIALAQKRAATERTPPRFIAADAQTYAFEPASFDLIVSRFGIMFFADPVQAFANLRRAAAPGGALELIAWRSAAENPFMTAAERAAAPFLPSLPPRKADEPGQFAFADRTRVEAILRDAGWSDIAITPLDVASAFPERELLPYLTHIGPVARALQGQSEATRAHVIATVRAAFDPYVHGDEVRYTAACWTLRAQAVTLRAAHRSP